MSSNPKNDSTTLFQSKEQVEQMKRLKDQYETREALKSLKVLIDEEKEPADMPLRPHVKEKKNPHLPYFLDNIVEGVKVLKEERDIKRAPVVVKPPVVQPAGQEHLTPTEVPPTSQKRASTHDQGKVSVPVNDGVSWYERKPTQPLTHQHQEAISDFKRNQEYYEKHGRFPDDARSFKHHSGYAPTIPESIHNITHEVKQAIPSGEQLKHRGKQFVDEVQRGVSEAADAVHDAIPSAKQAKRAVSRTVDDVKEYVEDAADNIADHIPRRVKAGVRNVVDDAKDYVEEGIDSLQKSSKQLPSTMRQAKRQAEEYVEDVVDNVREHIPSKDKVKQTVSNLIEDAEGYIDDVTDGVPRSLEKKVTHAVDQVQQKARDVIDSTEKIIPSRRQVNKVVEDIKDTGEEVVDRVKELNPFHKKTVGESIKEVVHDAAETVREHSPLRKKTVVEKAEDYAHDAADALKKVNPFHEQTIPEKAKEMVEDAADSIRSMSPFHKKTMTEKVSEYAHDAVDALKKVNPFREKTVVEKAQDYAEDAIDSVKQMSPFHKPTTTEKVTEYVKDNVPSATGALAAAAATAKLLLDDERETRSKTKTVTDKVIEGAKAVIPRDVSQSVTTTVDDVRDDLKQAKKNVKEIATVIKEKIGDTDASTLSGTVLNALTEGDADLPTPRQALLQGVEGLTTFCMKNNINFSDVLKENLFPRRAGPIEFLQTLKEEFKVYRTKKRLEKQWDETRRDVTNAVHSLLTATTADGTMPPRTHRELQLLLNAQDALKQDLCSLLEINPKSDLTLDSVIKGAQKIVRNTDVDLKDLQPIAVMAGVKMLDNDYEKAMQVVAKNASQLVNKIGDGHKVEQLANVASDINAVYNRTLNLLSAVSKDSPRILEKLSDGAQHVVEQGREMVEQSSGRIHDNVQHNQRPNTRVLTSVVDGQTPSSPIADSNPSRPSSDRSEGDRAQTQYITTDGLEFAKQQQPSMNYPGLDTEQQREVDQISAQQRKEIANIQRNKNTATRNHTLASLKEVADLQIFPASMSGTFMIVNEIMRKYTSKANQKASVGQTKVVDASETDNHHVGFLSYSNAISDTDDEAEYDGYLDEFTDNEDDGEYYECEDSDM